MVIEEESSTLVLDMRHSVYHNILQAITAEYQAVSVTGNLPLLLEYIGDLEGFFQSDIGIGGSRKQKAVSPPDCLDQEFLVNESEFEFDAPKSKEKSVEKNGDAGSNTESVSSSAPVSSEAVSTEAPGKEEVKQES